jgi:methylated-DNA-[protein]-cysteine S-methyltransferase
MRECGWALFETPIGQCGIAWGERGVAGVQLPEASATATARRLARRLSGKGAAAEPPPHVRQAIDRIAALLRGEPCDLSGIALDMADVPPFNRQVYAIARTIPPGGTLSYGEIATRLGDKALSRDVGRALGQNPFPIVVPCHRVLAAGRRPGGFSAPGGVATKLRLLAIEGVDLGQGPTLFDVAAAPEPPGTRPSS